MTIETYMQLREYGPAAWTRLLPTIFISDRVSTWLPSGHDIQKAHDQGLIPFSCDGFISLIEAKLIRVGARTTSYDPKYAETLMFKYDETDPLQSFLRRLISIGGYSDYVYLHEPSNASETALKAVRERSGGTAKYYVRAREIVDQYLDGRGVLHPIVVQRAREFAEMDVGKIDDRNMRDCISYIATSVQDQEEQRALHLAFQLIRLSLEHTTIMKNQQCNKFFEYEGYTRGFIDVVDLRSQDIDEVLSYRESLAAILELFQVILSARQPKTIGDAVKIHESMSKYRKHIWTLAASRGVDAISVTNELRQRATEYGFFRRLLGKTRARKVETGTELALSLTWPADMINLALQGSMVDLMSTLASASGVTSALGLALAARSISHVWHDRSVEMNEDPTLWPVALAVQGEQISHSDIAETMRLIEQVVKQRQ